MNQHQLNNARADVDVSTACNLVSADGELLLYGVIGDWWDELDVASIVRDMEAMSGDELVVRIHSAGGNIMEGLALYNRLKQSPKRIVVYIDGMALSMAGVVAMAADELFMPDNALFMMHKPWNNITGNADELRQAAESLDMLQESLVTIYAAKSGKSTEEINQMLEGEGTWLNGSQAVEQGFADTLIESIQAAASFDLSSLNAPTEMLTALVNPAGNAANPVGDVLMRHAQALKNAQANAADPAAQVTDAVNTALQANRERTEAICAIAAEASVDVGQLQIWLDSEDSVEDIRAQALEIVGNRQSSDPAPESVEVAVQAALAADRQRRSDIDQIVQTHSIDQAVAQGWMNSDMTVDQVNAAALTHLAERDADPVRRPHIRVEASNESLNVAMSNALAHRTNSSVALEDGAREFAGRHIIEVARAYLISTGIAAQAMTPDQVAARAMQSTSDFPLILGDVMNRNLRDAYEVVPRAFTVLGRRVEVPDFRTRFLNQLGEGSDLEKVGQNGEIKHGKISEAAESYKIDSYAKIFAWTRQMMINDDLSAFTRFVNQAGGKAAVLENSIVWGLIEGNAAMSDGIPIFHADHGNLGTSGGNITVARLSTGRKQLRKQTGLDSQEPLGTSPKFLVVSAERETEAQQFLAPIQADQAANNNPFASTLSQVTESRLADSPWYMFADPNLIDTFEYAYLSGNDGVYTETQVGFEIDGMALKVRHDFGAGVVDYRGMHKNNGA